MLGISAIAYMIVSLLVIFALSAFLGQYCMQRGVEGPESVAKRWAMLMRGTEVIVASGALYILWKPILHAGESGPHGNFALTIVAILYSIVVGGVYVLASLFAFVTVPMGDQVGYFRDRLSKMNS
jgi:hypothetical protein